MKTKADVILDLRRHGFSSRIAGVMVDCVLDAITTALLRDEEGVMIRGFGQFRRKVITRKYRHPATGEETPPTTTHTVAFKPTLKLRQRVESYCQAVSDHLQKIGADHEDTEATASGDD